MLCSTATHHQLENIPTVIVYQIVKYINNNNTLYIRVILK